MYLFPTSSVTTREHWPRERNAVDVHQCNNYPFTLDPSKYTPANTPLEKITGYNINANDPNLRFPQIWKTNLAIDQKLPGGLIATAEVIYNKAYNSLQYIDVNLKSASANFTGIDTRARYPKSVNTPLRLSTRRLETRIS